MGFLAGLSFAGLASAAMGSDLNHEPAGPVVEPESAAAAPVVGVIVARVQVAGLPGVVPAGGPSTPKPQVLGPAGGATIQIIDPRTPDALVAEQISDARGEVRFELAAASYWVVVPWNDHVTGLPGAPPVAQYLPNGQAVLAWQDVTSADGSIDVLLTIVGALS